MPAWNYSGDDMLQMVVNDPTTAESGGAGVVNLDIYVSPETASTSGPSLDLPDSQETYVLTGLPFSVADDSAITVGDASGAETQLTVSLSVADGVLTLASTSNLTFIDGTTNGHASLQFTGTAVTVNAALNGLTYLPNDTFVPLSVYEQTVIDFLNVTLSDATASTSGSVPIDVQYSPPDFTVPDDMTVSAGTTQALTIQDITAQGGVASVQWQVNFNDEGFFQDAQLPDTNYSSPYPTSVSSLSQNYTFSDFGDYDILVTVTDGVGQTTQYDFDVTVTEATPTLAVSVSDPPEGSTVTFTATITNPDPSETDAIYADFTGDGVFEQIDPESMDEPNHEQRRHHGHVPALL